jgi:hypothetical protein
VGSVREERGREASPLMAAVFMPKDCPTCRRRRSRREMRVCEKGSGRETWEEQEWKRECERRGREGKEEREM